MKIKVLKGNETATIKLGNGYSLEIERKDYLYEEDNFKETIVNYHLVIYLKGKYFTDITDYIRYTDYKIVADDTLETIKQKVFNYLNNKYVGVDDLQGTDFKIGDSMTLKEWKEWAISDRDMCDDDYGYSLMKKTPLKSIIDLIQDYWEITIKKVVLGV